MLNFVENISFFICRPCPTGTLLKVDNVTYFPDGRSVVECSGVRRFKTTNCRVKDGYNVAKLNYVVDRKPRDHAATEELSNKVGWCWKSILCGKLIRWLHNDEAKYGRIIIKIVRNYGLSKLYLEFLCGCWKLIFLKHWLDNWLRKKEPKFCYANFSVT